MLLNPGGGGAVGVQWASWAKVICRFLLLDWLLQSSDDCYFFVNVCPHT